MLKIEAIVEKVENGEITQLRIADDVYALIYLGTYDEDQVDSGGEEYEALDEFVKKLHSKEKKHKSRKKHTSGAIGKSKTYKVWIYAEERDKILDALGDKKLTSKDLRQKTGMTLNRIRATLDFMVDHSYIQKELDHKIMEPVYYATEKQIGVHQ